MLLAVVPARLTAILLNLRSMELVADFTGTGSYAEPEDLYRVELVYKPSILSILRKSYALIWSLELHGLHFQTQADFMGLLCALPHLDILVCHRIECPWSNGNMTTSRAKTKTLHLTHLTVSPQTSTCKSTPLHIDSSFPVGPITDELACGDGDGCIAASFRHVQGHTQKPNNEYPAIQPERN